MTTAHRYEASGARPPVHLRAEPRRGPFAERSTVGPAIDYDRDSYEGLLDYEAAARYLCTTPRHVRELWAIRCIAAVKVGRRVRFTRADLDAFIAAKRVEAVT